MIVSFMLYVFYHNKKKTGKRGREETFGFNGVNMYQNIKLYIEICAV